MALYYDSPIPDSHRKYFYPNIKITHQDPYSVFTSNFFEDMVKLHLSSVLEKEEEFNISSLQLSGSECDSVNSLILKADSLNSELVLLISNAKELPEGNDIPTGYAKDEKVSLFLTQGAGNTVLAFTSEEKKKAIVAFDNHTTSIMPDGVEKSVLLALPVLIKWRFNAEYRKIKCHPLVDYIKDHDMEKVAELVHIEYEKLDLRDTLIKDILGDFENRFQEKSLDKMRSHRDEWMMSLNKIKDEYCKAAEEYNRFSFIVRAMEDKLGTDEPGEFMEFCLGNKCIYPISLSDKEFKFRINTTIESFNPEGIKASIDNPKSDLYIGFSEEESRDCKKIYSAIFSEEPLIKIKVGAEITLRFSDLVPVAHDGTPKILTALKTRNPFPGDYLPNPHLGNHDCWGQNLSLAFEYYGEADYIGMMTQVIATVQNVNSSEPNIWSPLIKNNFNKDGKYLILPDGTEVSFKEAIEWLNQNQEA